MEFRLEQNYPNPFNPSTTIQLAVPKASHVTITIYDMVGRHVATLVDEEYPAGVYRVVFDAGELASGLYVYRITAGGFQATRKMLLLQ
ncbi:MAG: T9SS type A sorting domain-containing protein [candidate division KSB1 bacterium]|nr:T9SS type A sorting domain-containing protein [candidate division KSB1 bacterium]